MSPQDDVSTAYRLAPHTLDESRWLLSATRGRQLDCSAREFLLRKAALFDRIALSEERRNPNLADDARQVAEEAAGNFLAYEGASTSGVSARSYVRRAYAAWCTNPS